MPKLSPSCQKNKRSLEKETASQFCVCSSSSAESVTAAPHRYCSASKWDKTSFQILTLLTSALSIRFHDRFYTASCAQRISISSDPTKAWKGTWKKEKKNWNIRCWEACRSSISPRGDNGKRAIVRLISIVRHLNHLLLTFLPSALTKNSLLQKRQLKFHIMHLYNAHWSISARNSSCFLLWISTFQLQLSRLNSSQIMLQNMNLYVRRREREGGLFELAIALVSSSHGNNFQPVPLWAESRSLVSMWLFLNFKVLSCCHIQLQVWKENKRPLTSFQ